MLDVLHTNTIRILKFAFVIICYTGAFSVSAQTLTEAEKPAAPEKGLTFALNPIPSDNNIGTAFASCSGNTTSRKKCNPYQGDTVCSVELPVLCFKDINEPVPTMMRKQQYWSGGIIATTPEVAGSKFETIDMANRFCAAQFGKEWRIASFHDGGGWAIAAYGNVSNHKKRAWIDIKDQPKGTCWSR